MEHIGKYKGYNVYKTPKNEMKDDQDRGVLYAVSETGELVLNGEVVGKVAFSSGSVTEYDDHKCYRYKYPTAKRETLSMDNRRSYSYEDNVPVSKPGRGKRAEVVTVDAVLSSQVVDPTDLDELINEYILAARKMEIVDYVGEFKGA